MRAFSSVFAIASLAAFASAQQCSGNTAICPNNQDGTSSTYLQCDSWAQQYVSVDCPSGQVCYANPTTPGSIMCSPPGSGGVPTAGTCTGHTAKCADPGNSGDYFSCEPWSGQYVNNACPSGLKCYNNQDATGVICQ
ncbi:hypothetical protein LPJ77_000013 [Coemansia sp. RSA 2523]|nr:hypothetical protein LPJ58_001566 [Coemansia sp. RSA 1591]KAJ1765000.1 hypothetical protein LPJ69_001518 [Coemansia sp. RSA 1752]KAJ1792641.1 hypothetical protein LPJ67_001487 [Coemansia sp. RSA 1938]KAJ1811399.1 hypothetical protein LPJ77_000013 [Coemansia sp. RSA 2523]KAJ2250838.1 hypothetical protein GGH97_000398 [Coemansia sp. RSA 475]KAJ2838382.1 hypothetical protein J3B01_001452 [Coemansia erecta]